MFVEICRFVCICVCACVLVCMSLSVLHVKTLDVGGNLYICVYLCVFVCMYLYVVSSSSRL